MNSGMKLIVAGLLALFVAVGLYYGFGPQSTNANPKTPTAGASTPKVSPPNNSAQLRPSNSNTNLPANLPANPANNSSHGAITNPPPANSASSTTPSGPRPAGPVVDPLTRSTERPAVDLNAPTSGGKGDAPPPPPASNGTAPSTPTSNLPTSPASPAAPKPTLPGPADSGAGSGDGPRPVTPITPAPSTVRKDERTHVVLAGDTMSSLAEKYYGDKRKADVISKANPLVDPRYMKIGTKLAIPAAPGDSSAKPKGSSTPAVAPATLSSGEKLHVVVTGDTLQALARTYFGDATMAPYIYETNKALIGPDMDALKIGMKLVIPKKP